MKKLMKLVWRGHMPFKKVFWIGGIIIPAILVLGGGIWISEMAAFVVERSTFVSADINAFPRHADRAYKLKKFIARRKRIRIYCDIIATLVFAYLLWISAVLMKHVYYAMEGPDARYIWAYGFLMFSCSLVSFLMIVVLNFWPGVFFNQTKGFNVIGTYDGSCECHMTEDEACTLVPNICILKMTDPPIVKNLAKRPPGRNIPLHGSENQNHLR